MKTFRLSQGISRNSPKQIIVHSMGEYIRTPHRIYSAAEYLQFLGLSAHILVSPDGELTRCRNDLEGAYHAKGFNTDTLGIEFLVSGIHDYMGFLTAIEADWVQEAQYEAGAEQCAEWMRKFGIESILRHSDISPDRKVDPGTGFKWTEFLGTVQSKLGG